MLLLCGAVLFFGCDKRTEESRPEAVKEKKPAEKEFKMYEMSEMSALMEQMYANNQALKQRIIKGDTIGRFPQHFLKIHASAMTDPTENDAFFRQQAAKFIASQEQIYKDPANAKTHFNNAVSSCVACHEGKCEGPIPRIKKLYIK